MYIYMVMYIYNNNNLFTYIYNPCIYTWLCMYTYNIYLISDEIT